jgi:hypothetical protein
VSYRYYPRSHPEISRVDRSLNHLLDAASSSYEASFVKPMSKE